MSKSSFLLRITLKGVYFSSPLILEVNKQLLDSMNPAGTGYASAAGSLFPRTTENSPNFSVPGDENLGMTIDRRGLNKYSLNARNPDFQIEMNRLKPAERAFLTGRTDTISPTDSTYDDDEFSNYIGWGHSTWQEGIRLCTKAGVKKMAIFHHDPSHDDDFLNEIAKNAKAMWDGSFIATEGEEISFKKNDINGKSDMFFAKFNNSC